MHFESGMNSGDRADLSARFDTLFVQAAHVNAQFDQSDMVASPPVARNIHEAESDPKHPEVQRVPRPLRSGAEICAFSNISGYQVSFLNIIQTNLSVAQVLRLVYFGGEGRWLVGAHEGIIVCLCGTQELYTELQVWLSGGGLSQYGIAAKLSPSTTVELDEATLSTVLRSSFAFELNRSFGWIPISSEGKVLSVRDIITTPLRSYEKPHRNVPVLTVESHESQIGFVVRLEVFKYYPLSAQNHGNGMEGSPVVVLPSLSSAQLWRYAQSHIQPKLTNDEMIQYWYLHYGFKLPIDTAKSRVPVTFGYGDKQFAFPSVCVWRHPWSMMPTYTRQYYPVMRSRLCLELNEVVGRWNRLSGLQLNSCSPDYLANPSNRGAVPKDISCDMGPNYKRARIEL